MPDPIKIPVPDLADVEVRQRGQHDAGAWYSNRAEVEFNGLAVRRINKVSRQAGLQDRPANLLVVPDTGGQNLFVIPVKDHPKAVPASYSKSKCTINLSGLFAYLGYTIQPGAREFHRVEFAESPVQIGDLVSPALIISMKAEEVRWEKNRKKSNAQADQEAQNTQKEAAPAKE